MPQKMMVIEFGDLLNTAEKIGYHWNQAHDILFSRNGADLADFENGRCPLKDILNGAYKDISEDAYKIIEQFIKDNPSEEGYWLTQG